MISSVPVLLERDNVNDEFVVLVRWFVRHGDPVQANLLLAEVETSKANLEVYAPEAGFLTWSFPEGADVPVSSPIGYVTATAPKEPPLFGKTAGSTSQPKTLDQINLTEEGSVTAHALDSTNIAASPEFNAVTDYKQRFSPVAAKLMEMNRLTAKDFTGKSVVRKQDVLDLLHGGSPDSGRSIFKDSGSTAQQKIQLPQIAQPYQEIALSKMKRREGSTLAIGVQNAVSSAVSVTCFTRGLRQIIGSRMEGGNASAVIVYEVSRLLRKYPALNATYRNGAMLRYDLVNLGFAMDDGHGLKVAAIQKCDTLSLQEVSAQLRELTLAYINDRLTPAQISNVTFTISDLSGMGVSSFLPLISENQGGILGVGAEQFAPDSSYGSYTLTLTFDHQLTDGRNAALFLNDLKDRLKGYEGNKQDEQQQMICSQCGRTAASLAEKGQYLLRSAVPDAYLCTLCVAGY